ncbi:hypothetical protein CONPUDRAFT_159832 [Coniophora puteana RWD-64-598 SS2]|uniref:Uncharacterized protein n=1 Tax=Coniophora puteana (strain RWD-64-598) TaxID=741705 RepID=R7SED1_CONPW|nr:uncharacterized protein CONPUDRAFT_159832 [Coniophora puteana RWD-64-598 SS2]EIW74538.1 hypothetical protein CONPUDRAFT_159832 [Coniophora puteana RWD-64-598 SS2]
MNWVPGRNGTPPPYYHSTVDAGIDTPIERRHITEREPLLPPRDDRNDQSSRGKRSFSLKGLALCAIVALIAGNIVGPILAVKNVKLDTCPEAEEMDRLRDKWALEEHMHGVAVEQREQLYELWRVEDAAHTAKIRFWGEEDLEREEVRKGWRQEVIKHEHEEQEREEVRKEWQHEMVEHKRSELERQQREAREHEEVRREWEQEVSEHEDEERARRKRELEEHEEVRREWEQEVEDHKREEREKRKRELEEHEHSEHERQKREEQEREEVRRKWQREVLEHEREERERRKRELEERQKMDFFWADVEASHCFEQRVEACKETPLSISGQMKEPVHCEDKAGLGVYGTWEEGGDATCSTYFDWFKDKGCTAPNSGLRRYEMYMENLRPGDDWEAMCKSTPATFLETYFAHPDSCSQWQGVKAAPPG